MTVNVHSAFAVPFGDARHPGADSLNPRLCETILRLESGGNAFRNTTPAVQQPAGLFESAFEFFAVDDPAVQELRAWCWSVLGEFLRGVNPHFASAADVRIRSQTWFHVTRTGGYFGYHNHPMASWSAVYCVADGAPAPEVENNGSLVFPHPLACANSYLDIANASLRWPFSQGNYVMRLAPGQLVIFPSWLGHYVTPFTGDAERITVAFNAWFSAGASPPG